jgi:hypothetical protein
MITQKQKQTKVEYIHRCKAQQAHFCHVSQIQNDLKTKFPLIFSLKYNKNLYSLSVKNTPNKQKQIMAKIEKVINANQPQIFPQVSK